MLWCGGIALCAYQDLELSEYIMDTEERAVAVVGSDPLVHQVKHNVTRTA